MEIKNLCFSFGDKKIFENLDLDIPDTGITAIIAPSGTGKTTLLKIIAGLIKPDSGELIGVPEKVSYVFQEDRLLPWFTALENVTAVRDNPTADADAKKLLLELGITDDLLNKRAAELSGGQKRRVAIARALFFEWDLLLLDEPFTGLDAVNREVVLGKLREFAEGRAVILVSHLSEDIDVAQKIIEL